MAGWAFAFLRQMPAYHPFVTRRILEYGENVGGAAPVRATDKITCRQTSNEGLTAAERIVRGVVAFVPGCGEAHVVKQLLDRLSWLVFSPVAHAVRPPRRYHCTGYGGGEARVTCGTRGIPPPGEYRPDPPLVLVAHGVEPS